MATCTEQILRGLSYAKELGPRHHEIQECFKYCCLGSGYRDEPACCVPCKEFSIYALNFYRAVQCLGRGGCEWFTVHMHAFNTVCYILFMLVPFGPSITIESRGLLCDCPSAPKSVLRSCCYTEGIGPSPRTILPHPFPPQGRPLAGSSPWRPVGACAVPRGDPRDTQVVSALSQVTSAVATLGSGYVALAKAIKRPKRRVRKVSILFPPFSPWRTQASQRQPLVVDPIPPLQVLARQRKLTSASLTSRWLRR